MLETASTLPYPRKDTARLVSHSFFSTNSIFPSDFLFAETFSKVFLPILLEADEA